jgi:hypothetical protein
MNEQFLSFVWKFRLYSANLTTTSGQPVRVIKPGEQNSNSGPDFFNARIYIGDTLWAGNVEIHVKASDWYRHRHQSDSAYNNVILHVVYEADMDIIAGDLTTIPTLDLSTHTDPQVLKNYRHMRASGMKIPCGKSLLQLKSITVQQWIDRMLVERLEHKSLHIEQVLQVNRNDWEDAFYQLLARNFGFHVNAGPFEMLARCLPRTLLLRHASQLHQAEALAFGQAGLLEGEYADEYPALLQKEYRFLSKKYGLLPLDPHLWKLLRMRPANFPAIRISQFVALITSGNFTFQHVIEQEDPENLIRTLAVQASPYWCNHYQFDKATRFGSRILGVTSAQNIIINTIAPTLFYYGKQRDDHRVCELAFSLLRNIPAESNHILALWKEYGITADSAYTGQALTGLYNNLCSQKKCLICSLGTEILRNHDESPRSN